MKVAIVQPYLFPYIGYFQLINAVDKFVLFDDVNYIKRGWINRNNILVSGKSHLFSIPLKEASQNKRINELELSAETKWKGVLLKTIELNYKNAQQFETVFPVVKNIIDFDEPRLNIFIQNSIEVLVNYLEIKTEIIKSSSVYNNQNLKGAERIAHVCKQETADIYVNPIGGMEIYNKDFFAEKGISLKFLKSRNINYPQFKNDFVSWLSIIDVMMFNTPEKISELLNEYDFV